MSPLTLPAKGERRLRMMLVARRSGRTIPLAADGVFSNSKLTITYGTAIAHVAVDAKTGKVTLLDYVVVDDVGRVINPMTLHGQIVGAAVQGMGSVFTEEIAYDENGQILVGSLADYMLPVATDYPNVRACR